MFKKILFKNYFLIFLIFFTLFGTFQVKNYGYAWDNGIHRVIGFVNLKYILNVFDLDKKIEEKFPRIKNVPNINDHPTYKLYGSIFTAPLAVIEIIVGLTDNNKENNNNDKIYYLSCFFIFYIYCIALLFLHKTLLCVTENRIISFFGVIFFILSPRIFAESHYNISDIFLLNLVILTNYFFLKNLKKQKTKNFILSSLFCAFSIITKISAGFIALSFILVYFFKFLRNELKFKNFLNISIKYFLLISFFYYIFFPYLWLDPFNNIIKLIDAMINFNWNGSIYYYGDLIMAKEAPLFYQINIFLLTTPISHLFLFFFTVIIFIFIFSKNRLIFDNFIFFLVSCFLLIFLTSAIFQNTKYNGWRHIYFIYPYFITLIFVILSKVIKNNFFVKYKKLIYFFLLIITLPNLFWIIKYHPNQYAYFNNLRDNYHLEFDIDWWGISNKEAISFIEKFDNRRPIIIFSNGPSLRSTTARLYNGEENKVQITKNIDEANYVIDNSYIKNLNNNFDEIYKKVYEIKTNNTIISKVYLIK